MKKTGMIVKVETEINTLNSLFERWRNGDLDNVAMAQLIRKSSKKLAKINTVCYCNEQVCCNAHKKHVTPHQNCILR